MNHLILVMTYIYWLTGQNNYTCFNNKSGYRINKQQPLLLFYATASMN